MSTTIWKPHAVVSAIIENDGRYLLVEELSRGQHVYNQPAGHLEDNESFEQAVIRESLEEACVHFHPEAITGIYRWRHSARKMTHVRVCFCGPAQPAEAHHQRAPEILDLHWLSLAELEAKRSHLRSPLVLRCIYDYLDGKRYPLALISDLES